MKPGRYIKIGRLLIPIDQPAPDTYRSTYWVGKEGRAKRVADCKDHPYPRVVSRRSKIWIQILKARGEI